jgi:hypothetical protein
MLHFIQLGFVKNVSYVWRNASFIRLSPLENVLFSGLAHDLSSHSKIKDLL